MAIVMFLLRSGQHSDNNIGYLLFFFGERRKTMVVAMVGFIPSNRIGIVLSIHRRSTGVSLAVGRDFNRINNANSRKRNAKEWAGSVLRQPHTLVKRTRQKRYSPAHCCSDKRRTYHKTRRCHGDLLDYLSWSLNVDADGSCIWYV